MIPIKPLRHLRKTAIVLAAVVGFLLPGFGAGPASGATSSLLPNPLPSGSPPGRISLHVIHEGDGGDLLMVSVRLDGRGPYPFALDTGSANSVISATLAARLHLPAAPPLDHKAQGSACANQPSAGTTARLRLSDWKVGPVRLRSTDVVALAGFGSGPDTIDGLLGSDALSGLSALSVDYRTATATLGPAPANLPGRRVTLKVEANMGEVFPTAPVTIEGRSYTFVVDTGASESTLTPATSAQLRLTRVGKPVNVSGATCSAVAGQVQVSGWRLGSVGLPAQDLLSTTLPYADLPKPLNQIRGLIGGNVLASFGTVTIDYARQRLTLG